MRLYIAQKLLAGIKALALSPPTGRARILMRLNCGRSARERLHWPERLRRPAQSQEAGRKKFSIRLRLQIGSIRSCRVDFFPFPVNAQFLRLLDLHVSG